MKIAEPSFLLLFWLIPALAAFYVWAFRRREALLSRFARTEMLARLVPSVSGTRKRVKAALLTTAFVFGVLALLRPQWGFHWEEITRKGVDILVAVDVSQSMMAEDVDPNRLERAKRELEDLLEILEGDRIGLIAFAGTAFLQCPLTLDYGAFEMFLDLLSPRLIPIPGTSLTDAIRLAHESFVEQSSTSKALILITDGEDHTGSPLEAAKEAKEAGIQIYTIGIGGESEGALIPHPSGRGHVKDARGQLVLTRLDEETLQRIAVETGGAYVRSTSGNMDLERIYTEGIKASLEATDLKSTRQKKWEERFQWPLLAAVLILLLEPFVSERRRRGWLAMLLILGVVWSPGLARAGLIRDATLQEALDAYNAEDFEKALQKWTDAGIERPDDPLIDYNLGNAYYKTRRFEEAETSFKRVVTRAADQSLRAKALYNLGNTAYQQGKLDQAVGLYEKALELDPEDQDAKRNLELTREEIKRRLAANQQRQEQKQESQAQQQPQGDQDEGQTGQQQEAQPQEGDEESAQEGGAPQPKESTGEKQPSPAEPTETPTQDQNMAGIGQEEQPEEGAEQQAAAGQATQEDSSDEQDGDGEGEDVVQGRLTREEAQRLLNQINDQQEAGMRSRLPQDGLRRVPGGKPW